MSVERGRSYKHAKSAGKGSKPRPVNGDKYRDNYDAIFGNRVRLFVPEPKRVDHSMAGIGYFKMQSYERTISGSWKKKA